MLAVKNSTGEAYITALQACFDVHQPDILSGTTVRQANDQTMHNPPSPGTLALALQPRALEYIALRIQALEQLEHLRNSSPVEYLQARVATLQDRAIERLRHPLARVRHLILTSLHPPFRCVTIHLFCCP